MERRTGDTPMEFEYENRSGQRDANSPWPKGDPTKHGFASSNFAPTNAAPKPAFGSAFHLPSSFPQTPLKASIQGYRDNPAAAVAFSDTENPSSPDNADNEDTPEPARDAGARPLPPSVTQFRGTSPGKMDTTLRRISSSFTLPASWTRGREAPRDGTSTALMLRRAHKRKRPRFDELVRRHPMAAEYSDSDADDSRPASRERHAGRSPSRAMAAATAPAPTPLPPTALGAVPAFFAFLHAHPDLPRILSSYGQTLLTWFLIAVLVFLVWTCWSVVRADVDLAVQEAAAEIVREVARCAEEFRRNGCSNPTGPPPALAVTCHEWDACMRQDPLAVGRARVGARTFSRILNGFFEGMSWKFLACVGLLLVLVACNARALVPPFLAGGPAPQPSIPPTAAAGASAAFYPQQSAAMGPRGAVGRWHPEMQFETPYFAPPQTPGRRSPERRVYMTDEPGEGMIMGSPSRGSPRRLGYI